MFNLFKFMVILLLAPAWVNAREINTPLGKIRVEPIITNLEEPWSIGFLPNGGYLITLRDGALLYGSPDARVHSIKNLPKVQTGGQAGLFDVLVPSDFSETHEIYLSYAHASGRGTAVMAAKLDLETHSLSNKRELFVMNSPSRSAVHFGGRLLENGATLLLTLGERGESVLAQNATVDNGKIIEIKRDGSSARQLTKGHRNPQGLARNSKGQVFTTEHGAKGGDELNLIREGNNYGWPIISYGTHYDGRKIGEGTQKAGLEQPLFYWDPSIAPSGLAIHSGHNWSKAKDIFFIGSLKFDEIVLVAPQAPFRQIGAIKSKETERVRDVREAPDGSIWFLSVYNGAAYRIRPIEN